MFFLEAAVGIIDKCTFTLTCLQCAESEEASIFDRGSNWSGSHWSSSADFRKFDTKWEGGGASEPELITAKCKKCGADPSVVSKYSI